MARALPIAGVLQPLDLVTEGNGVALLLEDFGGISLHDYLRDQSFETGLKLDLFFPIASQLVSTLGQIHALGVIHKDIKPDNILINPQTGVVKIGDFGIASYASSQNPGDGESEQRMQGTLAYMSPEQTGRMNQAVDYRTDYYSLGVTFFQMLTGHLPFEVSDAMEIVHCHLAKTPPSLQEFNAELPEPLSAIVLKLLAKTAPERYQSEHGLRADLEECQRQLITTRTIQPFALGRFDRSGQLQLCNKLYGREEEVTTLLGAFERAASEPARWCWLGVTRALAKLRWCKKSKGPSRSVVVSSFRASSSSFGAMSLMLR
jgi:serine/threonine protein kinase